MKTKYICSINYLKQLKDILDCESTADEMKIKKVKLWVSGLEVQDVFNELAESMKDFTGSLK